MRTLAQKLLAWYAKHGRSLPWRATRNPYRILVSEIMLQQTQVDRVIPLYRRFLKTFPSWTTLATAKTADLLHAWAGLGYNRRALYLREAARHVVARRVPTNEDEWRLLKGVGPYAAAALTEFVNHRYAIVIDTNIRRVIGRVIGIPFPALTDDVRIKRALTRIVPRTGTHWDIPQACMDLANSVCMPRTPSCTVCPLRSECKSAKRFLAGNVIMPKKRPVTERIHAEKKYPDRIYRGRILALVREHGAVSIKHIGAKIDPTFNHSTDEKWVQDMVERLAKDGLVQKNGNILSLP